MTFSRFVSCSSAMLTTAAVACSSSEDTSASADAGASTPAPDATAESADDATVAVLGGVTLAGFVHPIDVYLPSNAQRAVVFLHGGGGSKEGAAVREIAIATDAIAPATTPTPDTSWLLANRTMFVLPQGQALPSAPKAQTWSNYVMTSGVDDVAFLVALSAALRAGTLAANVPGVPRVYLAGHSNGGMMANRMWCEQGAAFDAYGSLAGPASVQLDPTTTGGPDLLTGMHPCRPGVAQPYLGVVGASDTIIQTDGNWSQSTWAVNSCLQQGPGGSFVDPNLINEETFHTTVRLPALCTDPGEGPTDSADGKTTSWSGCGGRVRLERVNGADHCVVAGPLPCRNDKLVGGTCDNSLEAGSGARMRDVLTGFFVSTEP